VDVEYKYVEALLECETNAMDRGQTVDQAEVRVARARTAEPRQRRQGQFGQQFELEQWLSWGN
jgi:hypothetical protein